MPSQPDYIVIRRAPDLPVDFNTGGLDGKWFDRSEMPVGSRPNPFLREEDGGEGVAVPTGRFEVRDDGAVAEVWEIRP